MIGLELDAAQVRAVLVDAGGRVQSRATVEVQRVQGDLAAAAAAALREAGATAGAEVSVASLTPDAPPVIAAVTSLAGEFVAKRTVLPSGTAAVAAEAWTGAARGESDVALFSAGDRVFSGLLRDGRPVLGVHGRAASIAWMALNPVEREDYRRIGCVEAEVAGAGIIRRLTWRVKAGDHSDVEDVVGGDLTAVTVGQVLDAARSGDGVAISVVRDTAKYLGMAAANLVAIEDPAVLVLGGIMASVSDMLLDLVKTEIARRLPRTMIDALTIVPATLGEDAPAIGAARLSLASP